MTIIELNVPHQNAPACWAALDEDDYVARTIRANLASGWDVESPTFADAVAWNARDMSASYVYMSVDEAARAVVDGTMGNHQFGKARAALDAVVRKHVNEITDPDLAAFAEEEN